MISVGSTKPVLIIGAALFALLASETANQGGDKTPPTTTTLTAPFPHGSAKDGLAAFLICRANRFRVGEPITFACGLILVGPGLPGGNEGPLKLEKRVWRPLPPVDPDNRSWFEVTGPDGGQLRYQGGYVSWPTPEPSEKNTVLLRHGCFFGETFPLAPTGPFDLSKPGAYKVRWVYGPYAADGVWGGKLISNEVTFEVQ